jgi:hypothetical protein
VTNPVQQLSPRQESRNWQAKRILLKADSSYVDISFLQVTDIKSVFRNGHQPGEFTSD